MRNVYFYKMTVDNGGAPCVTESLLTLAICKPSIRRVAKKGSILFGFGANKPPMSNRLIYIAEITEEPLSKGSYYRSYQSRDDCIYHWRKDGSLTWKRGSKFHKNGSQTHVDIGGPPNYPKATVLLSRNFRYFGEKGEADYGDFPSIQHAVKKLGRGHRVHHDPGLLSELLRLKSEMWRNFDAMKVGQPTMRDFSAPCNTGGAPQKVCR